MKVHFNRVSHVVQCNLVEYCVYLCETQMLAFTFHRMNDLIMAGQAAMAWPVLPDVSINTAKIGPEP